MNSRMTSSSSLSNPIVAEETIKISVEEKKRLFVRVDCGTMMALWPMFDATFIQRESISLSVNMGWLEMMVIFRL